MNHDLFTKLTEKYPFITLCMYSSTEYVGIIQNQDDSITTIYDFGGIKTVEEKQKFLDPYWSECVGRGETGPIRL